MSNQVEVLLQQAADFQESNDFVPAAESYLQAYAIDADWRYANEAGICYQQAGKWNVAIEAFTSALTSAPDRYFVLFNIGQTYFFSGDEAKAIDTFNEVLSRTQSPKAAFELGLIAMQRTQWQDAIELFDTALIHDYEQNSNYNITGSNGPTPGLKERVSLNKARIYGFELKDSEKTGKLLDFLKESGDVGKIFTFVNEAIAKNEFEAGKLAASLLLDDYDKYDEVRRICDCCGVRPK